MKTPPNKLPFVLLLIFVTALSRPDMMAGARGACVACPGSRGRAVTPAFQERTGRKMKKRNFSKSSFDPLANSEIDRRLSVPAINQLVNRKRNLLEP